MYTAAGLGFLLSGDFYRKMMTEMRESRVSVYISAVVALIFGFVIVSFHNDWRPDWTLIVTIIGWLGLAKGILLFIFPEPLLRMSERLMAMKNYLRIAGIFALILGFVLAYFGFCPAAVP